MNNKILFTVFTPTFNRKELLPRVYNSLKKQTYRNFEWVVIDDGSTDGTDELIKQWQKEADFEIIYQWQPNQGKHFAYNAVAKIARGELFTSIDSDDEVTPNNLERLKFYWDNFTDEEKRTVGGISFPCLDQHGKLVGNKFPNDYEISDLMEMYLIKKVEGEKGGMLQTKAFKMYPFPEHIKNVVVPEGSFMYKFARDWKMCFINEPMRIFWIEGRTDSLSLFSTNIKNYAGTHYGHLSFINNNMRFFTRRPKLLAGEATRYAKLSFHLGINIKEQYKQLKPWSSKLLWLCFLPLGYISFIKDKIIKKTA
jgi:glycosyltransferase involved in cell wall biosynthesis